MREKERMQKRETRREQREKIRTRKERRNARRNVMDKIKNGQSHVLFLAQSVDIRNPRKRRY